MSFLKKLGEFLVGKDPEIFDDKGQIQHKLPKKKWDAWHQRTKLDPSHNWRNHSGITNSQHPKK
jgi:hypothetical protein